MTEILEDFLDLLDTSGLRYMLVGSVACGLYGQARATQDLDLVLDVSLQGLETLLGKLNPDRHYVSAQAARDALRSAGAFNVIDLTVGTKVDVILRKRRPFSLGEFERRQPVEYAGRQRWAASAEDVVLSKLENLISPSERQLRDVVGVIQVQGDRLDLDYMHKWAVELGVQEQLESLLNA